MYLSIPDTFAAVAFIGGLVVFVAAFSSASWVVLDGGAYVSLWRICLVVSTQQDTDCTSWNKLPDFARASQTFTVIALIFHIACLVTLVTYICMPELQSSGTVVVSLCLLTFTAGCMTLMATIVMGVKGQDHLDSIKHGNRKAIENIPSLVNVDLGGRVQVGWSLAMSIVSGIFTLISFVIWFIEYRIMMMEEVGE